MPSLVPAYPDTFHPVELLVMGITLASTADAKPHRLLTRGYLARGFVALPGKAIGIACTLL